MKKVLAVTDIHFRDSDFTTIKHSTKATEKVFYDIIKFAEKTDDLTIILGGDVFDKGYRQVGPSYAHRNLIERLHLACDGELYLVMGNHVFLERDSNPELYLMQPHSTFKPLIETYAIRPLLKVVDKIIINSTQFSLFHYNKADKNYYQERQKDIRYHIGIYHDDVIIPQSIRSKLNIRVNISSDYLNMIYSNIDIAIANHIHSKIGLTTIKTDSREIPLYIPGSIGITENSAIEIHSSVDLPLFTIDGDNLKIETVNFKIYLEDMEFLKKAIRKELDKDIIDNSEYEAAKTCKDKYKVMNSAFESMLSFSEYMRRNGFSDKAIHFFQTAVESDIDVATAVKILGIE